MSTTQHAHENPMKILRNGGMDVLIDALDEVDVARDVDADGNTALHAVLYNHALGRSPRLMEAVVMELLQTGADPFAKNNEGQTPRELACAIREADNLPEITYGAMSLVIWRLESIERELAGEKSPKTTERGFAARESKSQVNHDSWAQQVLKNRQVEKPLER